MKGEVCTLSLVVRVCLPGRSTNDQMGLLGRGGGGAMIILRVDPSLFSALRTGFEAAVCNDDAPIRPQLLSRLRPALADAAATAPRGRPILVRLESIAELYAVGDCFAVGGEGHPCVTDAQWDAINALIDQTARTAGP
jgi:hypothetical protein